MTDEQIKRLIEKTERGFNLNLLALPGLGWGLAVVGTGALVTGGFGGLSLFFGGLFAFPAVQVSYESITRWRQFKRARVWYLWKAIKENPRVCPTPLVEVTYLSGSIHALYNHDRKGEILPLKQAIHLLYIYYLQCQRREAVVQRLEHMRYVREQLRLKAEQLAKLGETNASALDKAEEMGQDIKSLEELDYELFCSCHRLESIVLSVHRAVQVEQLQREIAELRSSVASGGKSPEIWDSTHIMDLERQIGHEIETYLQLERETDAYLNGV